MTRAALLAALPDLRRLQEAATAEDPLVDTGLAALQYLARAAELAPLLGAALEEADREIVGAKLLAEQTRAEVARLRARIAELEPEMH